MTSVVPTVGVRASDREETSSHRFLRRNGLSLILVALFLAALVGQAVTGWRVLNNDLRDHGRPELPLAAYVRTGHFVEAVGENWESEFLQMAAFVWLTGFLFQKGSPESKDPDAVPEGDPPVTERSPWPTRRGGWVLKVYEHSLSITFLLLFLLLLLIHAAGGAREHSREQALLGQPPVGTFAYTATSQFWFESMQNWQSEFLAIIAMVLLGVFLREKGSPESKSVATTHGENEE